MMLNVLTRNRKKVYDVTIFQTPKYKETKGYKEVYRLNIEGNSHHECLDLVFSQFNIPDRIPSDYQGRFISTGDTVFIDEGLQGQFYYQLQPGGWKKINRVHVR